MTFQLSRYFPLIRLNNIKRYSEHHNNTFKGFVYFWFTNKGTQYFCLCLIKAHRFSICFQTSVPTAEKTLQENVIFFFLVPNLNTSNSSVIMLFQSVPINQLIPLL